VTPRLGGDKDMRRTLHDMDSFRQIKMTQSSPFFRQTKVQTCSHVVSKNGHAVAVAFPLEKTGWKNPNSYANTSRSSELESFARYIYIHSLSNVYIPY
jgi:hypothetical protein